MIFWLDVLAAGVDVLLLLRYRQPITAACIYTLPQTNVCNIFSFRDMATAPRHCVRPHVN